MLPAGLLQPLELPEKVWDEVTMDFIDGLPKSEGHTVILVVVDRLSKYAHFIPLRHPYTAVTVSAAFVREVVRLHGVPKSIVSDRDKVFLSSFWRELFRLLGTTLKRSTAYHPQSDGQTEVVNRCIETYLSCFIAEKPRQWMRWLPWAEYWYNTSFHTATQRTPFKALYGRDPPPLVFHGEGKTASFEVDKYFEGRDQALRELREQLTRSQHIMKDRADLRHRDVTFEVGDLVFLKLRPYRQQSVAVRANQKLAARYYGPFEVMERIGAVAYKLKLPDTTRIHPVFHVSQLKKMVGQADVSLQLPLDDTQQFEFRPATVQSVRTRTQEEQEVKEVLITWEGLPAHEASWEPYEGICLQFPDFHLEDKVNALGGSIDKIRIDKARRFQQIYKRRNDTKDA